MATKLTTQNMADILDKVVLQFDALKQKQDEMYDAWRGFNIDMYSHLSAKADSDIEVPLASAYKGFQEGLRDMSTPDTELSRHPQFFNLFLSLDNYCATEAALTEKTINGFLKHNDMRVTDKQNRLYRGITGRSLRSENVNPTPGTVFYATKVIGSSFLSGVYESIFLMSKDASAMPSETEWNNASYTGQETDGITFAPFVVRLKPNKDVLGLKLTVTWSDDTVSVLDYRIHGLPERGAELLGLHSGIKSVVPDESTRTMSDADYEGLELQFMSAPDPVYANMTFVMPTEWDGQTVVPEAFEVYLGEDETGDKLEGGESLEFLVGEPVSLFMRIKPSLLGNIEGKWMVDGELLEYGQEHMDGWWVNTHSFIPDGGFTITAGPHEISIAYTFLGTVDGNLANPSNYSPQGLPGGSDTIDVSTTNPELVVYGGATCDKITFNACGGYVPDINDEIDGDVDFYVDAGSSNTAPAPHFFDGDGPVPYRITGDVVFKPSTTNWGHLHAEGEAVFDSENGSPGQNSISKNKGWVSGSCVFDGGENFVDASVETAVFRTKNGVNAANNGYLMVSGDFEGGSVNGATARPGDGVGYPSFEFYGTSINLMPWGHTGTGVFYFRDASQNLGNALGGESPTRAGSAYFYDNAENNASMYVEQAFFNGSSINNGVVDAYQAEFNNNSKNYGYMGAYVIFSFFGTSENHTSANETEVSFYGTSKNKADLVNNGTIKFYDNSVNDGNENEGNLDAESMQFFGSSVNNGNLKCSVMFNETSLNNGYLGADGSAPGVIFTPVFASGAWTYPSNTGGTIGPNALLVLQWENIGQHDIGGSVLCTPDYAGYPV